MMIILKILLLKEKKNCQK